MKAKKRVEELLEEYEGVETEEDVYSESRDHLVEDDVLSAEEAGFMEGYDDAG